jgi:hypothetical protein
MKIQENFKMTKYNFKNVFFNIIYEYGWVILALIIAFAFLWYFKGS